MNKRIRLTVLSLILSACAGSADVVKTYELVKPLGAPYARILVVGAHPDRAVRRQFEESLVSAFRDAQEDAIASIAVMAPDARLGRETVAAAAEQARVDAVLVTRPEDVRWSVAQADDRSTVEAQRRQGNNLLDFFRYDYVEYEDPMSLPAVRSIVVASDLYRMSDRTLVWSVETRTVDKETAMAAIEDIASGTHRQLRKDGLIE